MHSLLGEIVYHIFFTVNVCKMDRETIKHMDSQRERELLKGKFGGNQGHPSGSASFSSMLMDPSLMPPGHGSRMFGVQLPSAVGPISSGGAQPQPQPPPVFGAHQMTKRTSAAAAIQDLYPVFFLLKSNKTLSFKYEIN
jgi:hypothetical protein